LRLASKVESGARKERSARLRALDRVLRRRFAAAQLGTVQAVVPERPAGDGRWEGITGNYLRAQFEWTRPVRALPALPLILLDRVAEGEILQGRRVSFWSTPVPCGSGQRSG
jgi:hypothetical protein